MDPSLEVCACKVAVGENVGLKEWIEMVKIEDEFVTRERREAREVAKEMVKEIYHAERDKVSKNPFTRPTVGVGQKNASTSTRPPRNPDALPKLTPVERSIIFNYQGCFKCRQLYVDHKGASCPNGFPSPSSYKPLTVEYTEAVRDSKNKPRSRGGPVAHVGYPEEVDVGAGLAVLGIGEEESDDSEYVRKSTPSTPFSSGHLEWHCRVDGPSEPVSVRALIDNGSHSVLVDKELVRRLGLRRR